MLNLKRDVDRLVVHQHEVFEGVHYITATCYDYEHFRSLPDVISFNSQICGKSAWNSDKCVVYYRSDMKFARAV